MTINYSNVYILSHRIGGETMRRDILIIIAASVVLACLATAGAVLLAPYITL